MSVVGAGGVAVGPEPVEGLSFLEEEEKGKASTSSA